MATLKKAVTVADYKGQVLKIAEIANNPGATRTEMLDSLDQIIEEAQAVYPDVLDDVEDEDEEDEDEDDEDEEEAA
ncbi:MAG: hypothetical protein ACR2LC_16985 [Pyrinomonadaceae bacterium]